MEDFDFEDDNLPIPSVEEYEDALYYDSYSLFEPKEKSMFIDYPELAQIPEFKKLSNDQMKFVYMIGCKTSKLYVESAVTPGDFRKIEFALRKAFRNKLSPDKFKKYASGSFDNDILVAHGKMKTFDPSTRMSAKMMIEKIFARYNRIISSDKIDDDVYVKVTSSIVDKLPELIRLKENAFGIITKKTESGKSITNLMDEVLNKEND